jgi:predicted kinase
VPLLILLNGPPGCGKSTIAQMYVDAHPLTLNLDVDLIRRLIGGWKDCPQESGGLARQIALEAAAAHLRAGHDVVVPPYLGRTEFVGQLEATAAASAAGFREIVLMTSREAALRRFGERSRAAVDHAAVDPTHVEAGAMARREGGLDAIGAMYDRLAARLLSRPGPVVVQAVTDDPVATYQEVLLNLAG